MELDKRVGKGICKYKNGDFYLGEWKNNNMHGEGVYTWADGRRYEG